MLCLSFAITALFACASTTVTPMGNHSYSSLPESSEVQVFASEKDIHQSYETVGIVEYSDPGKWQNITLQDAMPYLKAKALSIGANALIVDQSFQTKSGIFSRGIDAKARAIRLTQ